MIRDIIAFIAFTCWVMYDYYRYDFLDEFILGGKYYPRGTVK